MALLLLFKKLVSSGGSAPSGPAWLLEDDTGYWQLEDGSGVWLLE